MWKRCKEINYVNAITRHYSSLRHQFPDAPAQVRDFKEEVAKLIDVTTCIGCKACQVACSEWNDIRDKIGTNVGVYDNPTDLTAKSWTVMRFSEVEENGKFEWLIRKDGCMHCYDPGCLKACPSEGAIVQYKNGIVDFQSEHCIGCGYCIAGVRSTFHASTKKITVHTNVRSVSTALKLDKSLLA